MLLSCRPLLSDIQTLAMQLLADGRLQRLQKKKGQIEIKSSFLFLFLFFSLMIRQLNTIQ